MLEGRPLFELLLTPTRIYVKPLLALLRALPVHALAHITGGGLTDNIPRVLPAGLEVLLRRRAWPRTAIFEWLEHTGAIAPAEMYRTFNCGIGMVVIVAAGAVADALRLLRAHGEDALLIGEVRRGTQGVIIDGST
jgi:phosphoribosylformylglycinamidine cyclo-ligase